MGRNLTDSVGRRLTSRSNGPRTAAAVSATIQCRSGGAGPLSLVRIPLEYQLLGEFMGQLFVALGQDVDVQRFVDQDVQPPRLLIHPRCEGQRRLDDEAASAPDHSVERGRAQVEVCPVGGAHGSRL